MRHHSSPVYSRRWAGAASSRGRFVRAGEKEVYDPNNVADVAEYRTVLRYRQR